jgi:hypothetical protein
VLDAVFGIMIHNHSIADHDLAGYTAILKLMMKYDMERELQLARAQVVLDEPEVWAPVDTILDHFQLAIELGNIELCGKMIRASGERDYEAHDSDTSLSTFGRGQKFGQSSTDQRSPFDISALSLEQYQRLSSATA